MQETQVQSLGQEIPWRREWQPTPGFLPGEFHRQRSLAGYSPWSHKEWDMTEPFNNQPTTKGPSPATPSKVNLITSATISCYLVPFLTAIIIVWNICLLWKSQSPLLKYKLHQGRDFYLFFSLYFQRLESVIQYRLIKYILNWWLFYYYLHQKTISF